MHLANSGDPFKVALTTRQMQEGMDIENEEENMYTVFAGDDITEEIAFFFGHAVGKSTGMRNE